MTSLSGRNLFGLLCWLLLLCGASVSRGGDVPSDLFSVEFPASAQAGALDVPVTFHLWLPPGVGEIRALIVHQHGCGAGAESAGETAALDLQWRELARKHSAGLLSPHYQAGDAADCRRWCDPRRGSGDVFLKALEALASKTGHPEVRTVPWCLWGHSGGGFWASLMLERHAERIVAMVCRSGAATAAWEKGEIEAPRFTAAAYGVPILLNPGLKERGDARFDGAWTTTSRFFQQLRANQAPVAFAPDPLSGHECRNSRLMAIPYFDACLEARLGRGRVLKPLSARKAWWGDWEIGAVGKGRPALASRSWLPNEAVARAFSEYVRLGIVTDRTLPRTAPELLAPEVLPDGIRLRWTARADVESGVSAFLIYRNDELIASHPVSVDSRTGYGQFQGISYHDTPLSGAPRMEFVDRAPLRGAARYSMALQNGSGLVGPKSRGRDAVWDANQSFPEISPTVRVVEGGESRLKPEDCRAVLVGPGVNQPAPFPGYRGFVGWESPIRLRNGTWLVGFNAGFWHASPPTPFHYAPETVKQYVKLGMPADVDAPTGGRAMVIRSTDEGKTWSTPETIIDTPEDDRHPAFVELEDGTVVCSFFTYPGEPLNGDLEKDPAGAARVRFVRSLDGGRHWEPTSYLLKTPFLYDETDGPFLKLRDGSIVMAINGRPKSGPPDQACFVRSTDGGRNWDVLGQVGAAHDLQEVTVAALPDGRWIMMARAEGDVSWSRDQGRTWSKPLTFGMRLFAPSLYVLRDGTLVCLHGSYAPGHGGLRVIFSRDGGQTWTAPAKDHGFLVDSAYGYGKAMELPDGSLFVTYLATGGHRTEDARSNGIRCIRFRIRGDYSGIELLPAPNRVGP